MMSPATLGPLSPHPPARAVRLRRDGLVVDAARLSGAGVVRLLRVAQRPAPLHLLNSTWGDVVWEQPHVATEPDLLELRADLPPTGYDHTLPGRMRVAVVDPAAVDASVFEDMLWDWRVDGVSGVGIEEMYAAAEQVGVDLDSLDPDDELFDELWDRARPRPSRTLRDAEIIVADPATRDAPALRLRAPDPAEVDVPTWLTAAACPDADARAQAGVVSWPAPGPVGRVVRAWLAEPHWCPSGWRLTGGAAAGGVLDRLVAEGSGRDWYRTGFFSRSSEVAGVVLDGLSVARKVRDDDGDEVSITVGTWRARSADNHQTLATGFVPPDDLLAATCDDEELAQIVRAYSRLRFGGLNPDQAAIAAEGVLRPAG